MTVSVNTNQAALLALQNLNKTSSDLTMTQNRISTGLKVANAKDNGAVWAVAQGQRAQSSALDAVKNSLSRGQAVLDTTLAAGSSISDYLTQMKQDALAAADTSINAATRQKYADDYDALITQITNVVKSATFDGTNIIDSTSSGYGAINALANADGSVTVNVNTEDLSPTALGVTSGSLSSAAAASTEAANVDNAISNLTAALARLGVGSKALDNQMTFVGKLQDSLNTGVGALVDADVAKESANLQALQVKQQLSAQALSIANSAPQIVLSLFK